MKYFESKSYEDFYTKTTNEIQDKLIWHTSEIHMGCFCLKRLIFVKETRNPKNYTFDSVVVYEITCDIMLHNDRSLLYSMLWQMCDKGSKKPIGFMGSKSDKRNQQGF